MAKDAGKMMGIASVKMDGTALNVYLVSQKIFHKLVFQCGNNYQTEIFYVIRNGTAVIRSKGT